MDTEKMRRYAELVGIKQNTEDGLEALKAEIAELEAAILKDFVDAGVGKLTLDKGTDRQRTIYTQKQTWARAKDGDQERAQRALEAAGLADLIKPSINTQALSAVIREWDKTGVPIPEGFREAIQVDTVFHVRVRKGN